MEAEPMNPPTTPKKQKTGLRRRNIGAMGEVIFGRDPATSPTTRRLVADEDLLDILNLNRPGKDQDKVTENQLAESLDSALFASAPQTPRRESTSHTTPKRRTPRRRSKPMNPNVKPSAFKAMVDAHQARINKLIHEATRFGQSGREKHSPINILRALSRVPGFNQPRKPSPEREPIPGSDQWKKLTPKALKTMHLQTPNERDRIPAAPNFGSEKSSGSRSSTLDRNAMSVEKRLAFDKFRSSNPFLDPEDFNKLWEAELSIGRSQRFSDRGSFGMGIAGGEGHDLLEEDDTREHRLSQHDMTDPFLHQIELEERPLHLEDLTTGSLHAVNNEQEQQELGQSRGSADQGVDERGAQAPGILGSVPEPPSSRLSSDPESLSVGSGAPGIRLALSMSQQGSEVDQALSADQIFQQQQGVSVSVNPDARDIHMQGDADGVQTVEQQTDENLEEEGWEDIPDDENERGILDAEQPQEPVADVEHAEGLVNEFFDMTMAQQENDQNQQVRPMEEQQTHIPDLELEQQLEADLTDQAQGDQEVYEEDYMQVPDEDHVELQEHEERQGPSGPQYFDDFPSELGIMSNGNVLPTIFPKTKKTVRLSKAGIPVPSMPAALQKQHVHTFSRSRVSQEAMAVIMEGSHQFLEQASNDLAAYAEHAGRKTIDESDVELLMERLRLTNEKVSLESLLHRYLPRELRDKVLYPDEMQRFRRS
ncbi:hypothetical protein EC968_000314 [Mortierella alpina]|nr:hypothetical protein EC968_000314 [Mortierella alpina]